VLAPAQSPFTTVVMIVIYYRIILYITPPGNNGCFVKIIDRL